MTSYRSCAVPMCRNSTIRYPNKLFIHVPKCPKRRMQWLHLARRDLKLTSDRSTIYFCEDHFDLPNDMDNYIQYNVMGSVRKIRMKPDCLPSKFECLPNLPTSQPQEIISKGTEMPAKLDTLDGLNTVDDNDMMMDDDIDIEEHDLLDNPIIKSIFPDISVLKKEIECFYSASPVNSDVDDDFQVSSTGTQDDSTTHISEVAVVSLDSIKNYPNSTEIKEDAFDLTVDLDQIEDFQSNEIILGSKRNTSANLEQLDLFQARVLLNDLSSYLKSSGRYCYQCLTLFPDKTSFDSHNDLVHKKTHCVSKRDNLTAKHSYPSYICGKISHCGSVQSHLRYVHLVKKNTQSITRKTWNSHTIGLLQKKNSMRINLNQQINETAIKNKNRIKICNKSPNGLKKYNKSKNLSKLNKNLQDMGTEFDENYTCFHCEKLFDTQKSLVEHLYMVMQLNTIGNQICRKTFRNKKRSNKEKETATSQHIRVDRNAIKNIGDILNANANRSVRSNIKKYKNFIDPPSKHKLDRKMYYRCDVCSYYFDTGKSCSEHLMKKHRIIKKEFKKQPFIPNCIFCLKKLANIYEYDVHIFVNHKKKYTKKMLDPEQSKLPTNNLSMCVSFALKSTLFKCIQCDIHFLSAKAAMHHAEHMELLINWKCNKCHRIFKKNVEFLHECQHKYSNDFTVLVLSASALSRVLYNCSKCTVHFTEDQFLSHFPVCGTEIPMATYCKICDILIDENTIKSHETMHTYEKSLNFTIIDTDIISIKSEESSCVQKRKIFEKSDTFVEKKKKVMDINFDLMYCETCGCFLNKQHYYIHLGSQCVKLDKNICKICGLVFTNKCYYIHNNLHSKVGSVKLQNFSFCEVKSKNQICPPMPEYFRCKNCEVKFISKSMLLSHNCSDEDYLTCHICEGKLSDEAFKLHMSFHNYSMSKILKDGRRDTDTLNKEKKYINSPDLEDQTNCSLSLQQLSDVLPSKLDLRSSSLLEYSQPLTHLVPFNTSARIFVKSHSQLSKLTNTGCNTVQRSCSTKTNVKRKKSKLELVPIIYSCKNCGTTVDTYDKVIEHCQSHYEGKEMKINTQDSYCQKCDLKFDKTCYDSHDKLHRETTFFKLLNFDTYYFTSENYIWIKHVFGSMPQSLIDPILNKSVYRSECRVKMQIVQDGPPHLTVYKCDKCQCFIDESTLYKHAENSCFKLRCHPCTFCGLPFNSSVTRFEHEKIHETANFTVNSYRIVIFNRKDDSKFNSILYRHKLYTLYQCRNCDGITDKSQIIYHKCDNCNLKKCLECGLLVCGDEFETHILRHKELSNFTPTNMKVIMFGDKTESIENKPNKLQSSYCGITYDILYYRCSECKVCLKEVDISDHVCSFRVSRALCPECNLYFVPHKLKRHRKLHDDPDFIRENVRVITFDNTSIEINDECSLKLNETNKNVKPPSISPDEVTLKVANIYKCSCGLHFLDAISVSTHINCCNPKIRISKQKCTKCDLLFTPDILFSHLLIHHGDKNHKYTFKIVDMTCETDLTHILYKCSKCKLHFVRGNEVCIHLLDCKGTNDDGKQCNECNLLFNELCFDIHIQTHFKEVESGHKIYEMKTCSIPLVRIDEIYNKEEDVNELTVV